MPILDRKAIVITGAGSGIGRASAIEAAAQGALVVVNDIRGGAADEVAAEIQRAGGTAIANHDNVGSWDGAAEVVAACVREFGAIHGIVNIAGLCHTSQPWEETEKDIRAQVEANVLGVLFCGTHAMRAMVAAHDGGSIVNFSSGASMGQTLCATYGATKGAVATATFSWAFDLVPHKVRVNAISPATSSTMGDNWGPACELLGYPEVRPTRSELTAFQGSSGRDGPESIAPLVTYLLSDRSAEITGQWLQLHALSGHNRLSLIHHSSNHLEPIGPTLEKPTWVLEDIADAFDKVFGSQLQPVGDYMGRNRAWA
jgi:NAD(P)-dependent dehydrogenase (short-subunit alcohol dehydrogenase family)